MKPDNPLWSPSDSFKNESNLTAYQEWLKEKYDLSFANYSELWGWSTSHLAEFWESCLEYFEVAYDGEYSEVLSGQMPETEWFKGIHLNYAEHVFQQASEKFPAIIFKSESSDSVQVSWDELKSQTSKLSTYLKEHGVEAGDRVVGFLPTIPEASVAFLATNSLGAVWSSCSPDFGLKSVIDRFQQIKPKVLICTDGYQYNGKVFNKMDLIQELTGELPTLEKIIVIPYTEPEDQSSVEHVSWTQIMDRSESELKFTRVPFEHPIWVLYSSGTTGLPKAITHSNGGVLLEHLKYIAFHNNVKPGDRCFWYTTTGWMMWNYIQASWLCGGTVVLYDGSPGYPDMGVLWKYTEEVKINHFGTSAGYVVANMKREITPGLDNDLSSLISLGSTGSPLPPEGFDWLYKNIHPNLWITSISGGSDVCSAFVGGNPLLPVFRGEIQCRALGCDLRAFNEAGQEVKEEVGEMVICNPMPSMPIYFWNDFNFERYKSSYFEDFEGVWRHGDWTEITSHQGVIIYGRSDSTLNRGGVRIGTSEIYRAVDGIKEISDSLIIAVGDEKGNFYMPLFVMLNPEVELNDDLRSHVNRTIRNAYSPRHVPDEIIVVPDIPYTISGKKLETPITKIMSGKDTSDTLNRDALRNPECLDWYLNFAKEKFQSR